VLEVGCLRLIGELRVRPGCKKQRRQCQGAQWRARAIDGHVVPPKLLFFSSGCAAGRGQLNKTARHPDAASTHEIVRRGENRTTARTISSDPMRSLLPSAAGAHLQNPSIAVEIRVLLKERDQLHQRQFLAHDVYGTLRHEAAAGQRQRHSAVEGR